MGTKLVSTSPLRIEVVSSTIQAAAPRKCISLYIRPIIPEFSLYHLLSVAMAEYATESYEVVIVGAGM
jgi:hypothetical protein